MSAPAVLFVCLGNICRSPLAEAALRAEAAKMGLAVDVDSAGTGDWHVDCPPDTRAQAVAARHGIDISTYRGRQVTAADFRRFTHIFALDSDNLNNLRRIRPSDGGAALGLLMDVVPGREGSGVTDPYYGDAAGFDATWDDVTRAAMAIVKRLSSIRE
ncbi:MAG: low molecular weight protein-tyrosine-phosphatase [Pseudomonadota bacterium]